MMGMAKTLTDDGEPENLSLMPARHVKTQTVSPP